jgi:carboxylesterase
MWKSGPTGILLSHGYTATAAEVRPLAETLLEHGYTVAGLLLPGHGTSPGDLNRCRWQDWYAAVERSYHQLNKHCERVIVGGESLGSLLTLLLAARHPEIAGVLSYAPALQFSSKTISFLIPLMAPFIVQRPKPNRGPSAADPLWQGYPVNPIKAIHQVQRLQRVVLSSLPSIKQPALIMQGRLDNSISPRAGELVYQKIGSQKKEMHWLERSTHCVILDCEKDLAAELTLRFLESLS